ncbi:MAG: hypothetical protein ACREH3_08745 [Geminicoccales bacterium]
MDSPERLADLAEVLGLLARARVPCLLFGGWAEECLGLRAVGPHRDIDLVHLSDSFAAADVALETGRLPDEIRAKRFPHKRAFAWRGLCCEILLIRDWRTRPVTWFWGDAPLFWQAPVAHSRPVIRAGHHFRVVSAANLRLYRRHHRDMQPWRWQSFSGAS